MLTHRSGIYLMHARIEHRSFRLLILTAALACLSMIATLSPDLAPRAQAAPAVIDVKEDFINGINNPQNWSLYSKDSPACLTGRNMDLPDIELASGTMNGCNSGWTEAPSNAGLRLVRPWYQQAASLTYVKPLPTVDGMDIRFKFAMFKGGSSPADGMSFFIKKGDDDNDTPGFYGASLGYSPYVHWSERGMSGALLGIGFDMFGGWTSDEAVGTGCGLRNSPGRRTNALAIRGPGQGTAGYCYLGGTSGLNYGGSNTVRSRSLREARVVVDSADTTNPQVSVYFGGLGALPATPTVQVPLPKEFKDQDTFKFGFAASTGGNDSEIGIWGLTVKPADTPMPLNVNANWDGVVSGNETAKVTWTEPTGSPAPTKYIARARAAGQVVGSCEVPVGTNTCTITGLPTGSYEITVVSANADGESAPAGPVRLVLEPLTITSSSPLADATVDATYTKVLAVKGGEGPYAWSLDSGQLPAGLTLSPEGVVSGEPTSAGQETFTALVTDSQGRTTTKQFTLDVFAPLEITTETLPQGTTSTPYSTTLAATGGTTYKWELTEGTLPDGLELSESGEISGTPTTSGVSTFTVRVTDERGRTDERVLSLGVDQLPPVLVTTETLPEGTQDESYTSVLEATGGTAPYTWQITSGDLPDGVTLNGDELSGTPTESGEFDITVEATDSTSGTVLTDEQELTLVVNVPLEITTTEVPEAAPGNPYEITLTHEGDDDVTWEIVGGELPEGLELDPGTGQIRGVPGEGVDEGEYVVTIAVTDANGDIDLQTITIRVSSPIVILTDKLPKGMIGLGYGADLVADGGKGPYTWSLTGGRLHKGLRITRDGVIKGKPAKHGSKTVTLTVTDANGNKASREYELKIDQTPAPVIKSVSPDSGTIRGGSKVTISGTDFFRGGVVKFGSKKATKVTYKSATEIVAVAPRGVAGKTVGVTVKNPDGPSDTKKSSYTFSTQQKPVESLGLPKSIASSGTTELLQVPVRTNADQLAKVKVLCSSASQAQLRSDLRYCTTSVKDGMLSVTLPGGMPVRVQVMLSAPATKGYTAYSEVKTYRTG